MVRQSWRSMYFVGCAMYETWQVMINSRMTWFCIHVGAQQRNKPCSCATTRYLRDEMGIAFNVFWQCNSFRVSANNSKFESLRTSVIASLQWQGVSLLVCILRSWTFICFLTHSPRLNVQTSAWLRAAGESTTTQAVTRQFISQRGRS